MSTDRSFVTWVKVTNTKGLSRWAILLEESSCLRIDWHRLGSLTWWRITSIIVETLTMVCWGSLVIKVRMKRRKSSHLHWGRLFRTTTCRLRLIKRRSLKMRLLSASLRTTLLTRTELARKTNLQFYSGLNGWLMTTLSWDDSSQKSSNRNQVTTCTYLSPRSRSFWLPTSSYSTRRCKAMRVTSQHSSRQISTQAKWSCF